MKSSLNIDIKIRHFTFTYLRKITKGAVLYLSGRGHSRSTLLKKADRRDEAKQ